MRDHIGELQKINVSSWTEELKGVIAGVGGWAYNQKKYLKKYFVLQVDVTTTRGGGGGGGAYKREGS